MSKKGDAAFKIGRKMIDEENWEEAIKQFKIAIKKGVREHKLGTAYHNLGFSYSALRRHKEALEALETSLRMDPNFHHSWNAKGIILRRQNNLEGARECYQKALLSKPNDPDALSNIGVLYIKQGMSEEALEILKRAISVDPQFALYHANLALAYAMEGMFEEADQALRQSVTLGYKNWKRTQERVENLKQLAYGTTPVPNTTSAKPKRKSSWLPSVCPRCGGPTSPDRVQWIDDHHARCSFCGAGLSQADV